MLCLLDLFYPTFLPNYSTDWQRMLQGKQRVRVFQFLTRVLALLYPVLASRPYSNGGKPRFNRYSQLLHSEANYCLGLLILFVYSRHDPVFIWTQFSRSHTLKHLISESSKGNRMLKLLGGTSPV